MGETPQHLKTLEELGRGCILGLVQVLREEGLEAVRYFLWDMTGWHHEVPGGRRAPLVVA